LLKLGFNNPLSANFKNGISKTTWSILMEQMLLSSEQDVQCSYWIWKRSETKFERNL